MCMLSTLRPAATRQCRFRMACRCAPPSGPAQSVARRRSASGSLAMACESNSASMLRCLWGSGWVIDATSSLLQLGLEAGLPMPLLSTTTPCCFEPVQAPHACVLGCLAGWPVKGRGVPGACTWLNRRHGRAARCCASRSRPCRTQREAGPLLLGDRSSPMICLAQLAVAASTL